MLMKIVRRLLRRPLRLRTERQLAAIDAELAHWFVNDGTLAAEATEHDDWRRDLRERRLRAVADLEAVGGHDPWPTVLRPLTPEQKAADARRAEVYRLGQSVVAGRIVPRPRPARSRAEAAARAHAAASEAATR